MPNVAIRRNGSFHFAPVLRAARHEIPASVPAALLVSEGGDDHEMGEDFARTWIRAGDRLIGFAIGGAVIAAVWAVLSLIG